METIKSQHSVFYRQCDADHVTINLYKDPDELLITHWLLCCSKLSDDKPIRPQLQPAIENDKLFSQLSANSQLAILELLVSYVCSVGSFNVLEAALYYFKYFKSFSLTSVKNELNVLTNNNFNKENIQIDSFKIAEEYRNSIKSITFWGDYEDAAQLNNSGLDRYLTVPISNWVVSVSMIKDILRVCYTKGNLTSTDLLQGIATVAYWYDINVHDMQSAVCCYLIKVMLQNKESINRNSDTFSDLFKKIIRKDAII